MDKMPSKAISRSVPVRAEDEYMQAFRAFCDKANVHMADKVREALDATFGEQLAPYLAFFVAQADHKNVQSVKDVTISAAQS